MSTPHQIPNQHSKLEARRRRASTARADIQAMTINILPILLGGSLWLAALPLCSGFHLPRQSHLVLSESPRTSSNHGGGVVRVAATGTAQDGDLGGAVQDPRSFLTQRGIQSFMYLLSTTRKQAQMCLLRRRQLRKKNEPTELRHFGRGGDQWSFPSVFYPRRRHATKVGSNIDSSVASTFFLGVPK